MKTKVSIILVCLTMMASSMSATEGALRGKFAISATDTVAFSRGNLQYQPSTSTWRFAENQWDFVGTANGRIRSYQYSTEGWVWTYKGWLDLFGWGTGNLAGEQAITLLLAPLPIATTAHSPTGEEMLSPTEVRKPIFGVR